MNWKRKLELICSVITTGLGITVMLLGLRVEYAVAQRLGGNGAMVKEIALWFALYGLPGLLVSIGAYSHAGKSRSWGRLLLITASLFITGWFFLSLVLVVWSGLFLPAGLLTLFAILTSVVSLFVRGKRNGLVTSE